MLVNDALLLELSLAIDPALEHVSLCDAFVLALRNAHGEVHASIVESEANQESAAADLALSDNAVSRPELRVSLKFPLPGLGFLHYEGLPPAWMPGAREAFDRVLLQLARTATQARQRKTANWACSRSDLVARSAGIGSWEIALDHSALSRPATLAIGKLSMRWDSGLFEILEQPSDNGARNFEDFCTFVDISDRSELLLQVENFLRTSDSESGEMSFRVALPNGRSKRLFGKLFWLWNAECRTLIGALHDVTELEIARTESLYRSELESLLTRLSMKLISAPAAEFDSITQQALADVGEYVGADRAYLFRYDFAAGTASNTHEWCAEGIPPEIQNLQDTPIDAIEYWVSAHKSGLPLHLRRVSELPEGHALRDILEPQGIQSVISLPLLDGTECVGFIGFDAVSHERHWSDIDMSLLKLLAQLLVSAQRRFSHERQIQNANRKLLKARRHAEALAREANAASVAKSRFVATISHEMRTPLHAILGFADMLLNDVDQQYRPEHVVSIKESGEALLELINDVLDFSRIESANMPLQISDVGLLQMIDATARPFAAVARQKGIDLRYHVAPECPALIRGDEQRMSQVLRNIIGNAVKFTQAGEVNIHVTCHTCAGRAAELRVAVSDTGIGIAAEHIPHLFESFFQVDNGNDRVYAGTGLGLTIACMFAKLMGGRIEVRSELGKGSLFTFHVPVEQGPPLQPESPAPAAEKPAPKGLRVLLVEDNSVNRQLALIHLKGIECQVVMVENGQMAIDSFVREPFDLVLMDCQMPVMDGYKATELIRSHEASRGTHTPIIAVTASAIEGEKEQCLAVGMDDVLTKPFSRNQFLDVIARWANSGSDVR